jgi:hypothetical protein
MVLGLTKPITEVSTRNLPGGKARPAHKADNLIAIYEPTVYKMWEPGRLTTLWASTAWPVTKTVLLYLLWSCCCCVVFGISTPKI